METFLAVSGLRLDRAWREFDAETGVRMRAWSYELAAAVLATVAQRHIDAVVVVGGLLDRATALPTTVADAAGLLRSAGVPVIVVPGADDWLGAGSPYEYGDWSGVEVVRTPHPTPSEAAARLMCAAATAPGRTFDVRTRVDLPSGAVVVAAGVAALEWTSPHHLLTSGAELVLDETCTVIPPLVDPLGEARAVLLELSPGGVTASAITLGASPLRFDSLNLDSCPDTDDLNARLDLIAEEGLPVHVTLFGDVRERILLPGFSDWLAPPGMTLDASALQFVVAQPESEATDTADAHFLRSMAALDLPPLERHQATALGLHALAQEA
ncbi:hypothetical protein F0U44_12190 [Nocardioides humilatus]|uniref:Uncharacterized protein n=1 Tax=Nocardioides humilatus TaxID=2607660 RepID=A0A5B1LFT7_9ACTN|nr:hypothetical protein [Nocardioides humilatus]KAA1419204.1 hypothetical protein F0U44_12190 [Nocardioides humilatus]